MPLIPNRDKLSTFIFRIPHVHNLLIFKDVLQNKHALVSTLTEILKLGDTEILYVGYDAFYSPSKEATLLMSDAAIVRITFPDKKIICKEPEQTIRLAIMELQRSNSQFTIACDVLSHERNITAIALSVSSPSDVML